jgi:hypothetical protein
MEVCCVLIGRRPCIDSLVSGSGEEGYEWMDGRGKRREERTSREVTIVKGHNSTDLLPVFVSCFVSRRLNQSYWHFVEIFQSKVIITAHWLIQIFY